MEDPVPSQKRHSYVNGIGSKPPASEKKPPGIEISRLKGSRNSVSKKWAQAEEWTSNNKHKSF